MTNPVHKKGPVAGFATEDIISTIPKNIIAEILERVPIQDAVKTGILSRSWRLNWTVLKKLVFDENFISYLERKQLTSQFMGIMNRALLHLKGDITKFVLYIPNGSRIYTEDISHWILFLSTKGMEELTLVNMRHEALILPTHLFTCVKLRRLKLHNFHVYQARGFSGFPELIELEFHKVVFQSGTAGEFITGCSLLGTLMIGDHAITGKVKPFQIAKLQNLKRLSLSLCKLDTFSITSSDIFKLVSSHPKLEELYLDFKTCKFLSEAGARKRVLTAFRHLKSLTLNGINFNSSDMVLCTFGLIRGCPNLQKLEITATSRECVSKPPLDSLDRDYTMSLLETVKLNSFKGLKNELRLIKILLACSPLLKKMVIKHERLVTERGYDGAFTIVRELLRFRRASPTAELICE